VTAVDPSPNALFWYARAEDALEQATFYAGIADSFHATSLRTPDQALADFHHERSTHYTRLAETCASYARSFRDLAENNAPAVSR
jgi:hypothetical protein